MPRLGSLDQCLCYIWGLSLLSRIFLTYDSIIIIRWCTLRSYFQCWDLRWIKHLALIMTRCYAYQWGCLCLEKIYG